MVFVFIEILFKIVLFKGGVLIYAEPCFYLSGLAQRLIVDEYSHRLFIYFTFTSSQNYSTKK